ncbi:hypothetical protein Pfo_007373 [Paulownia fortunei]|nr:hypothetical protein Pfo_007373 [Paulownia fortunei]
MQVSYPKKFLQSFQETKASLLQKVLIDKEKKALHEKIPGDSLALQLLDSRYHLCGLSMEKRKSDGRSGMNKAVEVGIKLIAEAGGFTPETRKRVLPYAHNKNRLSQSAIANRASLHLASDFSVSRLSFSV